MTQPGLTEPLNAVLLYDERSIRIGTVREHVDAFRKYSRHRFYFLAATSVFPLAEDKIEQQIDLSIFDVLVVHYSVRLCLPNYFNEGFARQLESFPGLKILFIQDEYDWTDLARRWMDRLHFNIVYTCVPEEYREFVYPKERFPDTKFLPTLTGYVPEDPQIDQFVLPTGDRKVLVGYRGRTLHHVYGSLAHEKYRIGVDVERLARERGVAVDIEVDDSKRIYGSDWYRFIGSVRATLGTESGSNLFDFDGTLRKQVDQLLARYPKASFEEVHRTLLAHHDGFVKMNQISPKIFEAIRLRTALVLFEGTYSGVIQAEQHYIPLKKDYSNIDSVFEKLEDVNYIEELTSRTYQEIIVSGTYSYTSFVAGVDHQINESVRGPRFELFSTPAFARSRDDGHIRCVAPIHAVGFVLESSPLHADLQRENVVQLVEKRLGLPPSTSPLRFRILQRLWRLLPRTVRTNVTLGKLIRGEDLDDGREDWPDRLVVALWNACPQGLKVRFVRLLKRY